MAGRLTREECIFLIRNKTAELGHFPKKSDFETETVNAIKSYFGPWPRALEAAGVKEADAARIEKKQEKRKRAKENRIRYRKEHSKEENEE